MSSIYMVKFQNIYNCNAHQTQLVYCTSIGFEQAVLQLICERRNYMTANQIEFAKHKETSRHNLASEHIEGRKATASERQAGAAERQAEVAGLQQKETARHNAAQETMQWWFNRNSIAETQRHNKAQEDVNWFNANALKSHQERSDAAAARQAAASESQASTARINALTNRYDAETRRQLAGIESSKLAESIRHNVAVESETNRSNIAQESIGRQRNVETERANRASEELHGKELNQRRIEGVEAARHNRAVEKETRRANTAKQGAESAKVNTSQVATATKSVSDLAKSMFYGRKVGGFDSFGNILTSVGRSSR